MTDPSPNSETNAVDADECDVLVECDVVAADDRQLLEAFRNHNDESAFAAIVRRHGGLVMGVCRRILNNDHDAADSFQAVFLVLARKAASIRAGDVLSAWLYGVAVRTGLKARALRQKRAAREKQVIAMPEASVFVPERDTEAIAMLDEEVRAMPEKYRVPVILCELEGRSRKEAAEMLKLPEGTLSSRLAIARTKLGERLRRRGVAVTGVGLGVLLTQSAVQASVPTSLIAATAKAGTLVHAGHAATVVASSQVASLAEGVVTSMFVAKIKGAIAMFLAACLLSTSAFATVTLLGSGDVDEATALAALQKLGAKLTWIDVKRSAIGRPGVVDLNDPKFKELANEKPQRLLIGIDLEGKKVTDADLKYLSPFKSLHILNLRRTQITNAGAKTIGQIQTLHTLEVGLTGLSDAGFGEFASLLNLGTLRAENTGITDASAPMLAKLPNLTSLSIDSSAVTDAGFKALAKSPSLVALNASNTKITDEGLKETIKFPKLGWFALNDTAVSDAGLKELGACKNLTSIWVSGTKITDAGFKHLVGLDKLHCILAERNKHTDAGVKNLIGLDKLQMLSLAGSKVTNACIKDLAKLKSLNWLDLNQSAIDDDGMNLIAASLPRLVYLAVHGTTITDSGLKSLAPLQNLRGLHISWTKVTEDGLKNLLPLQNLRELRLGGLNVTDDGLRTVAGLKNLEILWLDWTKVSDRGLKNLAALPLKELRLNNTEVTDNGLRVLASLQQLKKVELQDTAVTDKGSQSLQKSLGDSAAVNVKNPDEPAAETKSQMRTLGWIMLLVVLLASGGILAGVLRQRRTMKPAAGDLSKSLAEPASNAIIAFRCPGCDRGLRAKPALVGKKVKCPQCGGAALVPAADAAAESRNGAATTLHAK